MNALSRPIVWIASVIALLIAVWVFQFVRSMTYEGDRVRSGASPGLLQKEQELRELLLTTGKLELKRSGRFEYCFAPIGGMPQIYAPVIREKGYVIDSVVGPMFAGSDTDWQILIIDNSNKKVEEISFPIDEFGMVDELDPRGKCGRELRLSFQGSFKSHSSSKLTLKRLIVEVR